MTNVINYIIPAVLRLVEHLNGKQPLLLLLLTPLKMQNVCGEKSLWEAVRFMLMSL